MNTLVWGFQYIHRKVIENLEKDGYINIKAWFLGTSDENFKDSKQYAIKHFTRLDDWHIQYKDVIDDYIKDVSFNEEVYNHFYSEFAKYADLETRYYKHGFKALNQILNKYNMLYRFIYALLTKEDIKLCLFSNLPHEGVDFVIYTLSKIMGIKTLLFCNSFIPHYYDRVFYTEDEDDYGDFTFMKDIYSEKPYFVKTSEINNNYFYMMNIPRFTISRRANILDKINIFFKQLEYKKNLKNSVSHAVYDVNYIYFPLHLQPELTTSSLGGIYCDQLLAIERLSENLPENWVIYVKENPKQTYLMRDKLFFDRLKLLKNVQLVSPKEDTLKLIRHSKIVATITGTAGFEAICLKKPVIVFGKAWYQNFEGVFKWNKDINIKDIEQYKINKEKLEKDYNNLISRMPRIVVDKNYLEGIKNVTKSKYKKRMKYLLRKLISDYKVQQQ